MNYVKLPQGVRDSRERECYNVNRVKEALRREGLFPAVFLQVADAQRRNPDEAIAFLQDEFIKKNIQLPSAYTRNIDAFAEAAENLVLDLLAQGDEQ